MGIDYGPNLTDFLFLLIFYSSIHGSICTRSTKTEQRKDSNFHIFWADENKISRWLEGTKAFGIGQNQKLKRNCSASTPHFPAEPFINTASSSWLNPIQLLKAKLSFSSVTTVSLSRSVSLVEKIGMNWKSRAWVVAGTVTAVEASKERNLCRWSSAKQQHQNVINNVGSAVSTQKERSSSSSTTCSSMASKRRDNEEMRNQSEESLRTIMYLSCWGPNS
ncbi:hypothetical protein DITRI_Ditri08aG0065900 [Diplodiscus trichospermus]